jgi:hypothetical protein
MTISVCWSNSANTPAFIPRSARPSLAVKTLYRSGAACKPLDDNALRTRSCAALSVSPRTRQMTHSTWLAGSCDSCASRCDPNEPVDPVRTCGVVCISLDTLAISSSNTHYRFPSRCFLLIRGPVRLCGCEITIFVHQFAHPLV